MKLQCVISSNTHNRLLGRIKSHSSNHIDDHSHVLVDCDGCHYDIHFETKEKQVEGSEVHMNNKILIKRRIMEEDNMDLLDNVTLAFP